MQVFDSNRYRPMQRLLNEEDFEFLKLQPGYRPEIARRLRRQRRRVLRHYLGTLSADFSRLHARARRMIATAPEEYHEMVGLLVRQRWTFWRVRAAIEVRLRLGFLYPGPIDVRALVSILDQMQAQLAQIAPAPAQ